MQVAISEAKGTLTDLVRRAEAGEEVILTRHGKAAARLVAVERPEASPDERWALLVALRGSARNSPGPGAARSQDFLYDDSGLPA